MNPFSLNYNPAYFCDREEELQQLRDNVVNGLNTLIHSPRRMGKSALIKHLFHSLENENNVDTIYVDLFATQNMQQLIQVFAERILEKYHTKNIIDGIKNVLKGISPTLSFAIDGTPQLSINLNENQIAPSLQQLFKYLESRKNKVVVAFDEFQEIAEYPEKAEALLRTYMQQADNVKFIFAGSSNHILKNMFYSASRPFYQSSEVLVLGKIKEEVYKKFIKNCFSINSKQISDDAIKSILNFTETYTYYTQVICNKAFFLTEDELKIDEVVALANDYIENRKEDYMGIYNLLSENQKKVVVAIAKEGFVEKPSSIAFLMKYKLPSASSTLQATESLLNKEIIYKNKNSYFVYDVFFKRFLIRYF